MSWLALVPSLGPGKSWPPVGYSAHSRVLRLAQDQVLRPTIPLGLATDGFAEHPMSFCSRAIWIVAGGVSLPFSPGLYGTYLSSIEENTMTFIGVVTTH